MKVVLNQQMQDEFGLPVKQPGRPPMTLKDVMVTALLTPIKEEEEKQKQEKWEIFKKIRNEKEETDLTTDEISLTKKLIGKFYPQMLMGEAHEMLEGKYEPMLVSEVKESKIE